MSQDLLVGILTGLKTVKSASRKLVGLSDERIQSVLNEMANHAWDRRSEILAANKIDLSRMSQGRSEI